VIVAPPREKPVFGIGLKWILAVSDPFFLLFIFRPGAVPFTQQTMAESKEKKSAEMPVQVQAQSPAYDIDYEKHGAQREANPLPDLKRKLKSRHLQMIAIGALDGIIDQDYSD
jgi:hypothetical protein